MSDNKKNVDLNKVSYNFGTKGWTVIGFEIVIAVLYDRYYS